MWETIPILNCLHTRKNQMLVKLRFTDNRIKDFQAKNKDVSPR